MARPAAKAPDTRCAIFILGGKPLKATRCTSVAVGWDALKRRACKEHMPKALWPVESRAVVKPSGRNDAPLMARRKSDDEPK
jgi:hypothetical protein